MEEIARLFNFKKREEISRLRLRVKHGIREELLELVSLKGIGRVRARKLYTRFKTLEELRKASLKDIASVPMIGEKLAASIKKQLGEEVEGVTSSEAMGDEVKATRTTKQSTLTGF
jgi:helicase